jgi:hypothetical protein
MATATATKQRQRNVLEYTQAPAKPRRIDRQAGILHGVKVLGEVSLNGQRYARAALENARQLYEGTRVYIDHPDRHSPNVERSLGDQVGWLQNVRLESDGLYGDLHFVKSHPMAAFVCEMAERAPGKFGLSHNAVVTESANDPNTYARIERVRSVDLVCKPATTKGIFESELGAGGPASSENWSWRIFAERAQKVFQSKTSTVPDKVKEVGRLAKVLLESQVTIDAIMKGENLPDESSDEAAGGTSDNGTGDETMESIRERGYAMLHGTASPRRSDSQPGRAARFDNAFAHLHRR